MRDPVRQRKEEVQAAIAIWLCAVPAFLYSVFLTHATFRSEHYCDVITVFGACGDGVFLECSEVFSSAVAAPFEIPLTIYSSAFYLLLAGLALALIIVRKQGTRASIRPLLIVLAIGAGAVTLGLIVFTLIAFGGICPLCTVLHFFNLAILGAGLLLALGGFDVRGVRGGRRPDLSRLVLMLFVGTTYSAAVIWQYAEHRKRSADVELCVIEQREECLCKGVEKPYLPLTELVLRERDQGQVVLAVFFDFRCPHCEAAVAFARELHAEYGAWLRVEFFHLQSDSECNPREHLTAQEGEAGDVCHAAKVLECVSQLSPESTMDAFMSLYALRDADVPFSKDDVAEVAQKFAPGDGLAECIESDAVLDKIRGHATFALKSLQFHAAPGIMIAGLTDGALIQDIPPRLFEGTKDPALIKAHLRSMRERVMSHD